MIEDAYNCYSSINDSLIDNTHKANNSKTIKIIFYHNEPSSLHELHPILYLYKSKNT